MKFDIFCCVILILSQIPNATSSNPITDQEYPEKKINQVSTNTEYIGQTLQNIEFEFYEVSEVIFIGNTLENVSISVNSVANVTIVGNEFLMASGVSILIWDSTQVLIESNIFTDVPEVAISIYETTAAKVRKNNISLSEENTNPWAFLVGINIDRSPGTLVEDNDVYSPLGDGVYIHTAKNSFVFNNTIHHAGFIGLSLSSSDNTKVIDNSITDSSSYQLDNSGNVPPSSALGISHSPGVAIINNLIDYSDYTGIDVVSSNSIEIDNNTVINHQLSGIFIGFTDDATVSNNIFYNNGINIETDQVPNLITENNLDSSSSPIFETISRTKNQRIGDKNPTPVFLILLAIPMLLIGSMIRKKYH